MKAPRRLRLLEGLVDIYLVDFKYSNPVTAQRLSHVSDYVEVALAAIEQMIAQTGVPRLGEEGYLERGVIVRHLVLPGYVDDSLAALDLLYPRIRGRALLSIMNQFTIVDEALDVRAYGLERAVSDEAYERVLDHADELGFEALLLAGRRGSEREFRANFRWDRCGRALIVRVGR